MSLPVIWSATARSDYADLLKYVEKNYGIDAALKILDKVEELVEAIETFPQGFPESKEKPNFRKAVITKQTSLIYRVSDLDVLLLYFWDNRREDIEI